MKSWFKYLIYASLVFLAIALYKADYLKAPKIYSIAEVTVSFVFMFAAQLVSTFAWKKILKEYGYSFRTAECIAGVGLSVFSKYVPGKVWIILGKAAYLNRSKQYSLGKLSAVSLNSQFIRLWVGLTLGALGFVALGGNSLQSLIMLLVWLGLSVVVFSRAVHGIVEILLKKILKRTVTVSNLGFGATLHVMPWFLLYWVLMAAGFYLLVDAITAESTSLILGLGFPLAATVGVMAVIFPAGLGAREGAMIAYLALAGLTITDATTIAVASRLWFLIGEVFLFTAGWLAHRKLNKCSDTAK